VNGRRGEWEKGRRGERVEKLSPFTQYSFFEGVLPLLISAISPIFTNSTHPAVFRVQ